MLMIYHYKSLLNILCKKLKYYQKIITKIKIFKVTITNYHNQIKYIYRINVYKFQIVHVILFKYIMQLIKIFKLFNQIYIKTRSFNLKIHFKLIYKQIKRIKIYHSI